MRQTYQSIIIVDNLAAFKGGQSGQRFTTVQQSDIANAASSLTGPNYALTGDITSEVTHVATDVKQGTLITVAASGLWTYQFSSARADQLARLITGKDKQDAQSILSNQKGVQSVSINISNNDTTMPGNASSINFAYVNTLVAVKEG